MTRILPTKLAFKLRLWRLGSRLQDKVWLQKPSFRFHLGRLGIKLNWTGKVRQAALRFENETLHVACRDELSNVAVIAEIFVEEQYAWIRQMHNVRTILDLGANIGLFSLYTHLFHPLASIICVEPDPQNLELLKQNLDRNQVRSQVVAGVVLASSPSGEAELFLSESASSHSVIADAAAKRLKVKAVAFCDLLAKTGEGDLDLVKCDIEGAEGEMFSGTKRELLLRARHYIIEYHSTSIRGELLQLFADDFVLKGELPINPEQGVVYFARIKL